ncbi:unnamed protein product [Absidia cylindrospora]
MSNEQVSKEEIETLKLAFQLYDHDEDGIIDIEEFKKIVMSLNSNMTDEAAISLAKSTDKNHDQMIDFDEFVNAMVKLAPLNTVSPQYLSPLDLRRWNTCPHLSNSKYDDDELADCFRAFDTNHDGKISQSELDKVMRKLGEELSKQDIQDMMAEADTNKDGYIDFEEFKRLLG